MNWIVYDEKYNKFYHFDTKASANRFYSELIESMKTDKYSEGNRIFVSQIKNCTIKEDDKLKQRGYF